MRNPKKTIFMKRRKRQAEAERFSVFSLELRGVLGGVTVFAMLPLAALFVAVCSSLPASNYLLLLLGVPWRSEIQIV